MSDAGSGGDLGPVPKQRSRVVMWSALAGGLAVAVLVAVVAAASPSSQDTSPSPLLGNQAPAVSGPGLSGGHYSLAGLKDRWVLVNFMASWCPDCQQEMPQLQLFYRQHAHRGDATVLAVEYDGSDVAKLRSYLARSHALWPAVDDPAANVAWGVTGLPSSYLVAPGGTVYAYYLGKVTATALDSAIARGAAAGLGRA